MVVWPTWVSTCLGTLLAKSALARWVAYHLQDATMHSSLCWLWAVSIQMILSICCQYFLNVSTTTILVHIMHRWRYVFFFSSLPAHVLNLLCRYARIINSLWLSLLRHAGVCIPAGPRLNPALLINIRIWGTRWCIWNTLTVLIGTHRSRVGK